MIREFTRSLTSARVLLSKAVSNRIIIPPASHFGGIGSLMTKIPRHEYKQLPDDSNCMEKFYNELEIFEDVLGKRLNMTYTDFENEPEELQFQLEKYIEMEVIPKHSDFESAENNGPARFVHCRTVHDKIVIERFLEFARGVKRTLMLNGGHTFIFDVLLQAKKVFDTMQTTRAAE